MGNVRHIPLRSYICDTSFDHFTLAATQVSDGDGRVVDVWDKIFRGLFGAAEFSCFVECFANGLLRVAEVAEVLEIILCGCLKDKSRIDCTLRTDLSCTRFVRCWCEAGRVCHWSSHVVICYCYIKPSITWDKLNHLIRSSKNYSNFITYSKFSYKENSFAN